MSREILVVAPYLPWPADFGGAIRIYEIIRHLARSNQVLLLAPAAPSEMHAIEHLREVCDVTAVPVRWTFRQPAGLRKRLRQVQSIAMRQSFVDLSSWEPRIQSVMDRLFMTRDIDLVQYEFPQMTRYRPLRRCPTVLDNHNVEHQLLARVARATPSLPQRVFNASEWRKLRRFEREAWSSVTLNLATSATDAEEITRYAGEPARVIPNGVDLEAFAPARTGTREPGTVLFVGTMRHQPNADAARWYVDEVHPLVRSAVPNAVVEIVGADPPPGVVGLARDSVNVTGRVDSVVPFLARASVVVVPLRAGGGTRLKILEAFAAGVPVVSTSIGAEGLDVIPGTHLLIADTRREFADAVIRVLRHDSLPPGYSTTNSYMLVAEQYDWGSAVMPSLLAAHEEAIDRFDRRRRAT